MTGLSIDIGIDETDRRAIAEGLSRLLADTYPLHLETLTQRLQVHEEIAWMPRSLAA